MLTLLIPMMLICYTEPATVYRLKVEPIDFTADSARAGEGIPHTPKRAAASGGVLYVSSPQDGYMAVMDPSGKVHKKLGRRGDGPGEFRSGLIGLSAYGGSVFAFARAAPDRLLHFKNLTFENELTIESHNLSLAGLNTNRFGVSADHVVMPAHPATGALAFAYSRTDETHRPVGDLMYNRTDQGMLAKNPAVNDTNWTFADGQWLALFRYLPLIQVFDASFNQTSAIQLEHPRLRWCENFLADAKPLSLAFPRPLFHDMAYRDGYLYLLAPATLFRVSLAAGAIDRIYTFYGAGPAFENHDADMQLHFKFIAMLPGNEVLLGPGFIWDHDVWKVRLPD